MTSEGSQLRNCISRAFASTQALSSAIRLRGGKAAEPKFDRKKYVGQNLSSEQIKKREDVIIRVKSGAFLVALFIGVICGGKQPGCALLVAFLQLSIFQEGTSLVTDDLKETLLQAGGQSGFHRTKWYIFAIGAFYAYGRLLCLEATSSGESLSGALALFVRWHLPAVAAAYMTVFINFVFSLQLRQCYSYQLTQFVVAHFAAFLCLMTTLVLFTMRAGLYWFILPSVLVIVNDIMAYACGLLFGKTPLISLSPKKTREGFFGAALCTMASAVGLTYIWSGAFWITDPKNVFLGNSYNPIDSSGIFTPQKSLFWLSKAEFHSMGVGAMASLLGPFGGFFASGVKRAFGVKDFGNRIPGHGGVADRFDCQIIMLPLVYFYVRAFLPELAI